MAAAPVAFSDWYRTLNLRFYDRSIRIAIGNIQIFDPDRYIRTADLDQWRYICTISICCIPFCKYLCFFKMNICRTLRLLPVSYPYVPPSAVILLSYFLSVSSIFLRLLYFFFSRKIHCRKETKYCIYSDCMLF